MFSVYIFDQKQPSSLTNRIAPKNSGDAKKTNNLSEDLQSSSKSCCFVLSDNSVWWFAHDDDFLIGHHNNSRQFGKPNSDIDESLKTTFALIAFFLRPRNYVFDDDSAFVQISDNKSVNFAIFIGRFDLTYWIR